MRSQAIQPVLALPYKEAQRPHDLYNLAFERALLGNFLACADLDMKPNPGFAQVPPENYFLEEHRILARIIRAVLLKNLPPQETVVYDELLSHYSEPRTREMVAYFSSLADGSPAVSPNWYYSGWINRFAGLRRIAATREALANADGPRAAELQALLHRAINELPPEPSPQQSFGGER